MTKYHSVEQSLCHPAFMFCCLFCKCEHTFKKRKVCLCACEATASTGRPTQCDSTEIVLLDLCVGFKQLDNTYFFLIFFCKFFGYKICFLVDTEMSVQCLFANGLANKEIHVSACFRVGQLFIQYILRYSTI